MAISRNIKNTPDIRDIKKKKKKKVKVAAAEEDKRPRRDREAFFLFRAIRDLIEGKKKRKEEIDRQTS